MRTDPHPPVIRPRYVSAAFLDDRLSFSDAQQGRVQSGPFLLAVMSTVCFCGAPFDLEATPNFKARLAESGLRWPPPSAIAIKGDGAR